tara:strand:+ start:465 stop:1445 length:981 start_codon:yes stop_codon:yes gene_type:complete
MAGNSNFDEILTTTLNNYVPKLVDNIFSARPLFYALTNGQTMRTVSGGAKIVVPVIYGTNSTAGSYSGTDTISTTAQTGISAAEYDWKQYAATVTINGMEEAKNNGEAQIIDLLEGKIFQTQETIIENMNTMFYADGTGNGGKDWEGIDHIVDGSTLTANTLGGIDPSAANSVNEWWTSAETASGGVASLTTAMMATLYNDVSVGNDQPTIIITSQQGYEKYESLLTSNIRYTDTDMADAGFQNLMFKGAPITFDAAISTGTVAAGSQPLYMLNTKYLQLVRHSDVWFKPTPFVRPTNQDAVFSQILCYGNLTCSNRARQGKLTGL